MRADALANRQRILSAATAVFAEQGISAEIKDIADRAGIGVGTIYRNFPGKNDLLIELIRGMMHEIAGALGEAEHAAEADPVEGLRLALRGMYEIAGRYGWLMEAKITGRLPDEVRQWVPPPHQDVRFQALVRIMERARERGLIRRDTDIPVSILMLFVTVYPLSCGPVRGGRDTAELADTVIGIVLSGIGTDAVVDAVSPSSIHPPARAGV